MDWKAKLNEEADGLRQIRDELRVQAHLGAVEAKERWVQLEDRFEHFEAKLRVIRDESKESIDEIGEAAKLLAEEIRSGYQHFKNLV